MPTGYPTSNSALSFGITITPEIHKDGGWYVAFCPEVPEANGQGRTPEESVESLKEGVFSILQDRRQDAAIRIPRHSEISDFLARKICRNLGVPRGRC